MRMYVHTDGRKACVQTVLTTNRDCGSAEWIKKSHMSLFESVTDFPNWEIKRKVEEKFKVGVGTIRFKVGVTLTPTKFALNFIVGRY